MRRSESSGCSAFSRVGVIPTVVALLALPGIWIAAAAPAAALPAECTLSATTVTCMYTTPGVREFVVPSGVSAVHVTAIGGRGGPFSDGVGARVDVRDLAVTPGDSLYAVVGGNASGFAGGFNGGGSTAQEFCGSGGGGASDIRTVEHDLTSRVLVAGGGGGNGCQETESSSLSFGGDAGAPGQPSDPPAGSAGGGQAGCESATGTNCGLGGLPGETPSGFPSNEAGGDGTLGYGGRGGGFGSTQGLYGGGGGGGLVGGGGGGQGGYAERCDAVQGACSLEFGDAGGGGGGSSLVPSGGSISLTSGGPMIAIRYALNPQPISFSSGAPPAGSVGALYSFYYTATGDSGLTYAASEAKPPGLTMTGDGTFSGIPTDFGTFTFTVTVNGDSGGMAQREDTVEIAPGPPPPSAAASVSPSSLDFGNQVIGTTSSAQTVRLSSTGDGPLYVYTDPDEAVGATFGGSNPSEFAVLTDGCVGGPFAPGASCAVDVVFQPTAAGPWSATLIFWTNTPDSPQSIPLSGTGTPPPSPAAQVSPASIVFGNQLVGTTNSAQTVTLSNSGDAPLTVSAATIGGPNAGDFTTSSDGCSNQTLAPAASCSVAVAFTPGALGSRAATLSFVDNAPGSPHTVSLSGTGVSPSADLAVSISATPNPVKSGGKITYTITVFNAGPSTATDVLLNDTLSSRSTFVSARPSQGSCITPTRGASGTISCSLGSLANGSSNVVEIVVTVIAKKTTITNTASVSSSTSDPNSANNTAAITTRVK